MARRRSGDRLELRQPADWVDDGIWRIMVCGPARAGASWICAALRALAREIGKWPEPADGQVDDATVRELIGEAWLELDPGRAWILRAHLDATDLLFGWRLVVVHRDPRDIVAELRRASGAPLPFLIDHVQLAARLVEKAAGLPGCAVLVVPWARLTAEPREVLAALARHVGVPADAAVIECLLERVGRPDEPDSAPPAPGLDGARHDPDPAEAAEARAAVEAALGPWMRRWGYRVEASAAPTARRRQERAATEIAASLAGAG
jgi:hypothetical protein